VGKVIVIGSINMDVVASAARLPYAGETVLGSDLRFYPGGKGANQAVAAARAGVDATLLGNVGDDPFAGDLTRFLTNAGVDTAAIRRIDGVASGIALIVVDGHGENAIVVVPGANGRLVPADVVERVMIERGDVVVAQLEIPVEVASVALARARARGATTVLNPTPANAATVDLCESADVVVLNETELCLIAGVDLAPDAGVDSIRGAVSRVARGAGAATVVTLGARGALAVVDGRVIEVAGCAASVVDATGAGDCFVGTLAARLAAGDRFESGLRLANLAASMCVERPGAGPSMPTLADLRERGWLQA
jgi:ribokinase